LCGFRCSSLYVPFLFALAVPSRRRSAIISRSNCPIRRHRASPTMLSRRQSGVTGGGNSVFRIPPNSPMGFCAAVVQTTTGGGIAGMMTCARGIRANIAGCCECGRPKRLPLGTRGSRSGRASWVSGPTPFRVRALTLAALAGAVLL
jgi:hypothetical protein